MKKTYSHLKINLQLDKKCFKFGNRNWHNIKFVFSPSVFCKFLAIRQFKP